MLLQRVQLHFVRFGLEANTECVTIYERTHWSRRERRLLGTFCGGSLPSDVTSSNNRVMVKFESDGGVTSSGFSIYYSAFTPVDGMCAV